MISSAKAKISFISCREFGHVSVKASRTVNFVDFYGTSRGHTVSVFMFQCVTRMVAKQISPPGSRRFWSHGSRKNRAGEVTAHYILLKLEDNMRTIRKLLVIRRGYIVYFYMCRISEKSENQVK